MDKNRVGTSLLREEAEKLGVKRFNQPVRSVGHFIESIVYKQFDGMESFDSSVPL